MTYRTEYLFNFNDKFEIHDDIEVLKRMGLAFGNYNVLNQFLEISKACFQLFNYIFGFRFG